MKKSQPFDNINFKKEEDPSTPIQKSNDNRTSRSSNRDLLKEKEEPHEGLGPIETNKQEEDGGSGGGS